MQCPLQAKYKYEDGLPSRANAKTIFGSLIHRSLQHLYDSGGDLNAATGMFVAAWANPDKYGYHIDYWPKYTSFGSLLGRGKEILQAVFDSHKWQAFVVLGTEVPFLVQIGNHELTGYIDLLGIEKSGTGVETLKIVDFKTTSRTPNIGELALNVQMTSYVYATTQPEFWTGVEGDPRFPGVTNGSWWQEVTRTINRRAIWWQLWTNRQIDAGPRATQDYQRLYRTMVEIDKASQAGIHVPRIGESCVICDYVDHCCLEIPVALKQTGDKSDPNRWI